MLIKLVENDDHATFTVLFTGEETLMVGCTHTISSVSSVSVPLLLSFRRCVGCCQMALKPTGLTHFRAVRNHSPLSSVSRISKSSPPTLLATPSPPPGPPPPTNTRAHTCILTCAKLARILRCQDRQTFASKALRSQLAYTFAPPLPSRGTIFLPAH